MIDDKHHVDALIIGAGASGLFCAMTASKRGKSVLVVDHANKIGKKILMSGGGRCNFTNLDVSSEHFLCQNPHFVKSALANYTPTDFINLVNSHKIAYIQKEHGQLFCQNSAKDIVNMLQSECTKSKVHIQLHSQIQQITALSNNHSLNNYSLNNHAPNSNSLNNHSPNSNLPNNGFQVFINQHTRPITVICKSLVIATGGLSIPTMGASDFGYVVAKQFGHKIVPTTAALVPFIFTDKFGKAFQELSGISIDVAVFNHKARFVLPLLFTHRGLSGPAILQLSNYWQTGESFFVDLFVGMDMTQILIDAKTANPKKKLATIIAQINQNRPKPLPKKVLAMLENLIFDEVKTLEIANIKTDKLRQIGQNLNQWTLTPAGTEGYRTAEVTRGGVSTDNISSKTMQSQLQPNLYFIGEVLDVTGHLGGYNFQWAWASGFACGSHVS